MTSQILCLQMLLMATLIFPNAIILIAPTCQMAGLPSFLVSLGYSKTDGEYVTKNSHSFLSLLLHALALNIPLG